MDQPLVSIVMSNYNCDAYIKKSIESVLSQTYKNFEFIIIDDASTDKSREIIDSFSDNRIRKFYFTQNEHMCYAFNYAISQARGSYVARIDSDDYWVQTKLEKQVSYMNEHLECGACFTRVTVVDENDTILTNEQSDRVNLFKVQNKTQEEWIRHFYFNGSCLCHPSVLMRKKVIDEVGLYNLSLVQIQDYDMWVRIVKKYPIYVLQENLINYRWFMSGENASAPSAATKARSNYEFAYVLSKYLEDLSDDLLIKSFGNDFTRVGTTNHEELLCERVLLLLKPVFCGNLHRIGAMEKLINLLQNNYTRDILREKYSITQKNFYELSAVPLFLDAEIQLQLMNVSSKQKYTFKTICKKIIPLKLWEGMRKIYIKLFID